MEINFPKIEKRILKFWRKNKVFEKSIERKRKAKDFIFYEGPPTVNAEPGLHHVLSRVFKDIICRYKTMRGFRVLRKAGWDTHGLPVELEIEKKLGLKTKKDIENYGVAKFNEKCKKLNDFYIRKWEKFTERIGFWLDLKNPYITYNSDYIETLWWILKEAYKKGLLYEDYKVVPHCPRCQTSLSSHEVALGYERIKEPSIYVKFEVKSQKSKVKSYLLVWTTTPWTLPGNVAIAINPNFDYIKLKSGEEILILAKERKEACKIEGKILEEFKGEKILGLEYEPFYPMAESQQQKAYKVLPADFVSLKEGTGLVHIAPAFGEEDMELIKDQNAKIKDQKERFPILMTVDEEGKMVTPSYKWNRLFVKEADPLIIEDLKKRNLLFKEEIYEHDYPFCWRCHTPLLYYAKKSWFLKMSALKEKLIENNKRINWIPEYLKEGRFGEWLREIKDWALSRERYWGTPLPIWKCKECRNFEVIGSKKDLISQKFSKNKYYILRHGQTTHQTKEKEIVYDWPGLSTFPLTKKGKKEIKSLAKKLKTEKIDLIYSSDTLRARQSAEILAKELGLNIIFDERLRDINLGIYAGGKKEIFYRDFPLTIERFQKRPKGGECWADVRKRMLDFINDIDRKYKGKKILIVSHGDPLWLLEGAMGGLKREELLKQQFLKKYIEVSELRKIEFKKLPLNEEGELDFHRPFIDEVKFYCQRCGNLMERIPEVVDCWFDSGAMPFAQAHFPFALTQNFIKKGFLFPADYISEAIDQTRGWFYTLHAISTLLGFGPAFKNVISLGHVLDKKGEKMSKSKGNVVNPWSMIQKYGADTLRWYFFTINRPEDSKFFSERDLAESLKKFILIFWNCFQFYKTYAIPTFLRSQKMWYRNILDRWIVLRLNQLILKVTKSLDEYDIVEAARQIENFLIEDLSSWYIRRSRKRFQKPKNKKELKEASAILRYVILNLSKLSAPFVPFLSEEIYQSLKFKVYGLKFFESVHLEDWPMAKRKLINEDLEGKMEMVREIVALALAKRKEAKIKVRQPLASLKIKNQKLKIRDKELLELIKEEVNVKEIIFDPQIKEDVELDTKITPELREEGIIREIIRNLQEMRKEAGFTPRDNISISFLAPADFKEFLLKNKETIVNETRAKELKFGKGKKFKIEKEIKIDEKKLFLAIKKVD